MAITGAQQKAIKMAVMDIIRTKCSQQISHVVGQLNFSQLDNGIVYIPKGFFTFQAVLPLADQYLNGIKRGQIPLVDNRRRPNHLVRDRDQSFKPLCNYDASGRKLLLTAEDSIAIYHAIESEVENYLRHIRVEVQNCYNAALHHRDMKSIPRIQRDLHAIGVEQKRLSDIKRQIRDPQDMHREPEAVTTRSSETEEAEVVTPEVVTTVGSSIEGTSQGRLVSFGRSEVAYYSKENYTIYKDQDCSIAREPERDITRDGLEDVSPVSAESSSPFWLSETEEPEVITIVVAPVERTSQGHSVSFGEVQTASAESDPRATSIGAGGYRGFLFSETASDISRRPPAVDLSSPSWRAVTKDLFGGLSSVSEGSLDSASLSGREISPLSVDSTGSKTPPPSVSQEQEGRRRRRRRRRHRKGDQPASSDYTITRSIGFDDGQYNVPAEGFDDGPYDMSVERKLELLRRSRELNIRGDDGAVSTESGDRDRRELLPRQHEEDNGRGIGQFGFTVAQAARDRREKSPQYENKGYSW